MNALVSQLLPLIYLACLLALLWQAFKVMGQGFRAIPRPGDPDAAGQGGVVTDFNEGLPHQQPARIELEQLLRPGVDVADVASLIQQDPAGS